MSLRGQQPRDLGRRLTVTACTGPDAKTASDGTGEANPGGPDPPGSESERAMGMLTLWARNAKAMKW
jgi:hypothetical protein